MSKIDLTGRKFGRLTVIEEAGRDKFGAVLWRCRCDCGNESIVLSNSLRRGNTLSCGCLNRERTVETHTKHGLRKHHLYKVWQDILRRCGVYKCADAELRRTYIERGITVCKEWCEFLSFYVWSLNSGYAEGLQIDRIDNDRGYSPDNCRWVTPKQNVNNRRNTRRLFDGTPLAEFCSDIGIATRENGKMSSAYSHIADAYRRHNKIHPDLFNALEKDLEKQERLLSQARTIRKEWEAILDELKERFKSLPPLSNQ